LNVASDGNMLVCIPLDKKSSWYLFGLIPQLKYGVGAYFPQPPISITLCCQDAHNFYAASDGNMIVYLTLDNKCSWYLSGVVPPLE